MIPKLTDEELAALRELAPRSARTGLICFELCPMCGRARWVCSDSSKPEQTVADVSSFSDPCVRCQEVHARSPEVFRWVLDVVGWRARIGRDSASEKPAAPPQP